MILNINQLRCFYMAIKYNSISLAAKKLMVTPPAISMQIKLLEKTLGFDLLIRKKNSIQPTEIGEKVFSKAESVFGQLLELEKYLEDVSLGEAGEFRIACHEVPSKYIMPKLIGLFNQVYPKVKIIVELGKTPDMIERIHNHDIPMALVVKRQIDAKLVIKPVIEDEIVLIAAKNSKFVQEDEISIQQLQTLPLIVHEKESGIMLLVNRHLEKFRITPNIVMETGSQDILKEFLTKDMGLAFIENFAIQKELKEKRFRKIAIKEGSPVMQLGVCYLKERQQSPIIQAFLTLLDENKLTHNNGG